MSVPALRFKDDDGQDFSNWHTKPLAELAKIYDGTHMTPDYQELGIPFYSVEHVTANNFSDTKFISRAVFEKENKRVKLERGDILMTRIGDIGTPKYIDWDVEASFYVSLALIKQSEKINSLFLSHYINTNIFQKELHQRIIHVAFPKKINLGEIGNCYVAYPCDKEQTKIANFLTAVDEKITQLTKKHDLLTQYKKGVMQQIFSQELRFKDDDGEDFPEWKERSLGEIGKFKSGAGFPDSQQGGTSGIPFYKVSDMNLAENKLEMLVANNYVSEDQINKMKFKVISDEAIVFAKVGAAIFLERKRKAKNFLIDNNMMAFIPTCEVNFIKHFMDSIRLSKFAQVGALPSYNASDLSVIEIALPCIKEQTKIASFFTAIDDKITATQTQLQSLKQYKQGLLQQMFV
jgi:type I restriction enzyme S subunit